MRVLCKISVFLLAFVCLLLPERVFAQELTISGNGNSASSDISVASQSQTTVTQSNTGSVENTISSESTTGANSVSDALGDTSIQSGNAVSQTTVTTVVNTSTVSRCCDSQETVGAVVAGNGSDSVNTIQHVQLNSTTANATNSATLTNTIQATATSGQNRISNTNGNARLVTGSSSVSISVESIANRNVFNVSTNKNGAFDLTISGNGSGSQNEIIISSSNNSVIQLQNTAVVVNDVQAEALSGQNTISNIGGTVMLSIGDTRTQVSIASSVNLNKTTINNCDPDDPGRGGTDTTPTPTGTISQSSSQSSIGGSGNSDPGIGGVLAATNGEVLPATGGNLSMWATIFNVFMLLLGLYLRRTAGRSPALE